MSNIAPEKLLACTLKILCQLTLQAFACGFITYGFSVFTRVLSGIASAILLVLPLYALA
ncbi:hypothetical protein K5N70_001841 [Vibrio vulnificus]|uniref:hypothetical protein n=1 Tax=Vibrio vulnificus TaxID=672 RepID=UPI0013EE8578|nr:hypothetical protein [Vibrio vulnificus]EHZ2744289.1 hypothetical protein [Vibrio vulnificus]ELP5900510.1 hypothetical protein [Vibrio vulnificus]